jgi:hypothetical protein
MNVNFSKAIETISLAQKALDNSDDGITIAIVSEPDMPLVYVNNGFERMTGYSKEEVVGKNCRFLQGVSKEDNQIELNKLRYAMKTGEASVLLLKNYKKNGELFYNELSISPLRNENNEITHYLGIQKDVTKRILQELEVIELNEKLKATNNELLATINQVNELQSIIAHDIKNPLTAITGNIEILKLLSERDNLNRADVDNTLKKMKLSVNWLNSILKDFLEIKKLDSNKVDLHIDKIDWNSIFDMLYNGYKDLATSKQISLDFNVEVKNDNFSSDSNAIMTVLDNLVSNAIKYTLPNKKVVLNAIIDNNANIEIIDEGLGMKNDEMHLLFKPFSKLSNKPTGKEVATGLGLYIVKKYIDLMQGSIVCESTFGLGTKFQIELPNISTRIV